jgi:hypothetical protein
MPSFVKVEKNKKNVPTDNQLTKAMTDVGGIVVSVEGTNAERTVRYIGNVDHNEFQNKLEEIVPDSNKLSWNFIWGDAITEVLERAKTYDISESSQAVLMLNSLLAATEKSVTIQIAANDLTLLKTSRYRLCFAKKVGDNAYDVVWQSYTNYLSNNTFSWTPQYELFGSNTFQDNVRVDISTNVQRIGLGEVSILNASGLLSPASTGGPSTSITLRNQYGPIHPGINQISKSSMGGAAVSTPIYVAQYPVVLGDTSLTPVEKVLVWFQQDIETGTMFSESRSMSIEIDLTFTNSATRLYTEGQWTTP